MYQNIPKELKKLPQWVVWTEAERNGKLTKIPFTTTGLAASVTDSSTWSSFEEAAAIAHRYSGIGFVLTKTDPYCIIDLDNKPSKPCTPEQLERHQKIYEAFDSYTELSHSKAGVHIVVKAAVPSGLNRDNVEVYSESRYMAFTGNVLRNSPIQDYQELVNILWSEMQPAASVSLAEQGESVSDEAIVEMAMRAANADKFNKLCSGQWRDEYPSQSEADFALLSIVAFYTQSNEQVRRIFRMSALGKREKAIKNNTYLDFALGKIRAQQPPSIDFSQFNKQLLKGQQISSNLPIIVEQPSNNSQKLSNGFEFPPGLIGDLARYFYDSSIRPVKEISLLTAIACVSGVAGRTFNINGAGLNQYLILLAKTGTGKETCSSGISRMFAAAQPSVPMITQFKGPAVFASGPALQRVLSEKPCFVSVLGEFGFTVQRLSNKNANSAEKTLKQLILDAYGKSGFGQVLDTAAYSDKEKNIAAVTSPNITILGESTPEAFYDGLDQSHIAEGFLSRFLILEYTGERPDRNPNFNTPPSQELIQKFQDLASVALMATANQNYCPVACDPEAQAILDRFDKACDQHIRGAGEAIREIWNRAHLKALKLAALLAVGVNPYKPVVTTEHANWAIHMVESDCHALHERFFIGDVGSGDGKLMLELRRVMEQYSKLSKKSFQSYGVLPELFQAGIIPMRYLLRKTSGLAAFRNDKLGSTNALKRTLQSLEEAGEIQKVPAIQLQQQFKFQGNAYILLE